MLNSLMYLGKRRIISWKRLVWKEDTCVGITGQKEEKTGFKPNGEETVQTRGADIAKHLHSTFGVVDMHLGELFPTRPPRQSALAPT